MQVGTKPTIGPKRSDLIGVIGPGKSDKHRFAAFRLKLPQLLGLMTTWPKEKPMYVPNHVPGRYETFLYIRLDYRGIAPVTYTVSTCWEWDYTYNRWSILDDSRYTYRT